MTDPSPDSPTNPTGPAGGVHPPRRVTAVDAVADAYVEAVIEASPLEATHLGIPGHDDEIDDLSPEGYAHTADLARETLRRLDAVEPVDDVDEVTVAAMRERLGLVVELHDAGHDRMELNVIASPLQGLRDVLDPRLRRAR